MNHSNFYKPVISVITPVLNEVDNINGCILSVLKQDFKYIEHIIVDGGSIDGTIELLNKYNESIIVINDVENKGLYSAINKGIESAVGEWVIVLGADDRLCENSINRAIKYMINNSCAYYGNVILKSSGKKYDGKFSLQKLLYKNISHQALFYPTKYSKLNLYNTRYKILSDYEYLIKFIGLSYKKLIYIPVDISHYNDIDGISSNLVDKDFFNDKITLIKKNFPTIYFVQILFRSWILYLLSRLGAINLIKNIFNYLTDRNKW